MRGQGRALPERLAGFVQLKARQLKVLHDPCGEFLVRVVRRVLAQDAPQ
jgi:hypothetical protein